MKRIHFRYGVFFILLLAGLLTLPSTKAAASSASIDLSAEPSEVKVGDTVTVSLTIKGTVKLGGFEAFLNYNSGILEFEPAEGSQVSGGDGTLRIYDQTPAERSSTRTYEMEFTAVAVGGCEISIKDKAHVFEEDGGEEMSVSSNRLSLSVKASETASTNTNLYSLKISPGALTPEFDPAVLEYSAYVAADIEELIISAIPSEGTSVVEVAGNKSLAAGENVITITVKAESADIKEYHITVTKEGGTDIPEDEETDAKETGFYVREVEGTLWMYSKLAYQIEDAVSLGAELPEGYEAGSRILFGKRLPVYAPAGEPEAESVLIYVTASKEQGSFSSGFYRWNTETGGMLPFQPDPAAEEEPDAGTEEPDISPQIIEKVPAYLYVIVAVLALLSVLLGTALILVLRHKGRSKA